MSILANPDLCMPTVGHFMQKLVSLEAAKRWRWSAAHKNEASLEEIIHITEWTLGETLRLVLPSVL